MDIHPIIYDDSSDRSILTFDDPSECHEGGPISAIQLMKDAGVDEFSFVSPNMHNFMRLMKVCEKHKIRSTLGLEMWITDDAARLDEQSRANESKVIIWMTKPMAYASLVNLHNAFRAKRNEAGEAKYFYYHFRYDWAGLKANWSDDLAISIPFFDSFLARNLLNYGSQIIPDFPAKPFFHREIETGHPHEGLINAALDRFNAGGEYSIINTKTIYYARRADFKTYLVYRAMKNKTYFDKPELDFLCSPNFSWEDYMRLKRG